LAGEEWLDKYTRFRKKVDEAVDKAHEEVFAGL
jgi:hypothetical protein